MIMESYSHVISSDFKKVVELSDSYFKDFMAPELFYQYRSNQSFYLNHKYNLHFYHDFDKYKTFDSQIHSVSKKYARRINRFYESIKEPTLFFRYLSNQEDYDYALENIENIQNIIKRFNKNNNIEFICNDDVIIKDLKVYKVKKDEGNSVARKPFDKNEELKKFISTDIISKEYILQNLDKYKQKRDATNSQIIRLHGCIIRKLKHYIFKPYIHDKIKEY